MPHGFEIELEVAGEPSTAVVVALLGENNLVDESAGLAVGRRDPGEAYARQLTLEGLQERHEVPDREDVVLHEDAEARGSLDRRIKRMAKQAIAKRADRLDELFLAWHHM
jgi:hypothetical protein